MNAPDSIYRQNIIRKTYLGNNSMIDEDLRYDIKSGYIKELTNQHLKAIKKFLT